MGGWTIWNVRSALMTTQVRNVYVFNTVRDKFASAEVAKNCFFITKNIKEQILGIGPCTLKGEKITCLKSIIHKVWNTQACLFKFPQRKINFPQRKFFSSTENWFSSEEIWKSKFPPRKILLLKFPLRKFSFLNFLRGNLIFRWGKSFPLRKFE